MNTCKKCKKEFEPTKGLVSYCSLKCRNSRNWSDEDKEKKSKSAKNSDKVKKMREERIKKIEIICEHCKQTFSTIPSKNHQRFCSTICANNSISKKQKCRINGLKSAQIKIKRSKNEIIFYKLCEKQFINVEHNKPIFNNWDADVIIHDLKIAVLWNGKWHYEKITQKHSLEQVQNRDKIKKKEIEIYGYRVYEIKDMGSVNEKFVEEQFEIFLRTCNSEVRVQHS